MILCFDGLADYLNPDMTGVMCLVQTFTICARFIPCLSSLPISPSPLPVSNLPPLLSSPSPLYMSLIESGVSFTQGARVPV